jgi:hypothetical protein
MGRHALPENKKRKSNHFKLPKNVRDHITKRAKELNTTKTDVVERLLVLDMNAHFDL